MRYSRVSYRKFVHYVRNPRHWMLLGAGGGMAQGELVAMSWKAPTPPHTNLRGGVSAKKERMELQTGKVWKCMSNQEP